MPFPSGLELLRRTPSFTASTTPKALLSLHDTKAGVWGAIVVESGSLLFIDARNPHEPRTLGPGRHEVIEPLAPHRVEPQPGCVFFLELLRQADER